MSRLLGSDAADRQIPPIGRWTPAEPFPPAVGQFTGVASSPCGRCLLRPNFSGIDDGEQKPKNRQYRNSRVADAIGLCRLLLGHLSAAGLAVAASTNGSNDSMHARHRQTTVIRSVDGVRSQLIQNEFKCPHGPRMQRRSRTSREAGRLYSIHHMSIPSDVLSTPTCECANSKSAKSTR